MPSAWAGTAALRRHLVGGQRWRSLLPAIALAGDSPGHGATPCDLTAGNRQQAPPLQVPAMPACDRAYKGVLAVVGCPLTGGLGHNRLPLAAGLAVGGRPCMGASHGWPAPLLVVLAANV
ncbi:hypothetical protein BHE74_00048020 [Ensete ventricosum]|nr:hypothetical protein BHE74_00048020 [Ensete ventricosum]